MVSSSNKETTSNRPISNKYVFKSDRHFPSLIHFSRIVSVGLCCVSNHLISEYSYPIFSANNLLSLSDLGSNNTTIFFINCSSGVRLSLRARHENCWGKKITELDNRLNNKYYQTKIRLNKNMSVISCHKKQNLECNFFSYK